MVQNLKWSLNILKVTSLYIEPFKKSKIHIPELKDKDNLNTLTSLRKQGYFRNYFDKFFSIKYCPSFKIAKILTWKIMLKKMFVISIYQHTL